MRPDLFDTATERYKAKVRKDCKKSQPWPVPAAGQRLPQSQVEKNARRDGNQNDTCVGSSLGFVDHITNRDAKIMKAVKK